MEDLSSPITFLDWDQDQETNLAQEEKNILADLEPESDEKMKLRYMDFIRIVRRVQEHVGLPDHIRQLIAGMEYFDKKIDQMELQEKDVTIVIGPAKCGKTATTLALTGT